MTEFSKFSLNFDLLIDLLIYDKRFYTYNDIYYIIYVIKILYIIVYIMRLYINR